MQGRKIIWWLGFGVVAILMAALALAVAGCKATVVTPEPETPTPPAEAVVLDVGTAQTAQPGGTVTIKVTPTINDGSTVQSIKWTQTVGVQATLSGDATDTLQVTMPGAAAYRDALLGGLRFADRVAVQPINPHALTGAEVATFQAVVTTSSGTYRKTVNVTADIPYAVATGLANVPRGVPVLLNGEEQASYDWIIANPAGSQATLSYATTRNPSFTPDVAGKYTLTESVSGATIDVYAGTWVGAISGIDANGRPLATGCTGCHNGTVAPDMFTAWKESGHAEIFTQNIENPQGHWSLSCAGCHTVGYDPKVVNGGFDEAVAASGWQVPPHGDEGLWATIVKDYPAVAKLANIQCENCHGPNDGNSLHLNGTIDAQRVSLSADLCGSCHGEPLRHGRFQQWEESKHAGTSTTPARGLSSASCTRCHSGQGFLIWLEQGDLTKSIQGANGNATVDELRALGITPDTIEPITCAVCHDPHDVGTVSGVPTAATRPSSANVRVMDATAMLPSGWKAENVGKGALCMTCHNTRNAVHGDDIAITSYSAPHTAAQGDVLMGENAFFVEAGARSPHASLIDTCVTCHMEATPPPAEFSYQGAGTNHSFEASITVCAVCHSELFNGAAFQTGVAEKEHELGEAMGAYFLAKVPDEFTIKDYTPHVFNSTNVDALSDAIVIRKDNIESVFPTEPHGQQGFFIRFKTPVTFTYTPTGSATWAQHTVSLAEAEVRLGEVTTDGRTVVFGFTDPLVRAGWNFFLIEGDGSKGVHNPAFTMEVLNETIKALK